MNKVEAPFDFNSEEAAKLGWLRYSLEHPQLEQVHSEASSEIPSDETESLLAAIHGYINEVRVTNAPEGPVVIFPNPISKMNTLFRDVVDGIRNHPAVVREEDDIWEDTDYVLKLADQGVEIRLADSDDGGTVSVTRTSMVEAHGEGENILRRGFITLKPDGTVKLTSSLQLGGENFVPESRREVISPAQHLVSEAGHEAIILLEDLRQPPVAA